MESIEITPTKVRGIGNIMDDNDDNGEESRIVSHNAPKGNETSSVEYDGAMWPIMSMTCSPRVYEVNLDFNFQDNITSAYVPDTVRINITARNYAGNGIPDKEVQVLINGSVKDTVTTNGNGDAVYDFTDHLAGVYSVSLATPGSSRWNASTSTAKTVTINKYPTECLLEIGDGSFSQPINRKITIKGFLTREGLPVTGKTVEIRITKPNGVVKSESGLINRTGYFSCETLSTIRGLCLVELIFAGGNYYSPSNASSVVAFEENYSAEGIIFDDNYWNTSVTDPQGITSNTSSLKYMTSEYSLGDDYSIVLSGSLSAGGALYLGLNTDGTGDYIAYKADIRNTYLVKCVNGVETTLFTGNFQSFNTSLFNNGITIKRVGDTWNVNGTEITITGLNNTIGLKDGVSVCTDGFGFEYLPTSKWTTNDGTVSVSGNSTTVTLDRGECYVANNVLYGDFEITFNATLSDAIRIGLIGGGKKCRIIQDVFVGLYRIRRVGSNSQATITDITFERSTNGVNWTPIISREVYTLTDEVCQFRFCNFNPNNDARSFAFSDFQITLGNNE